MRSRGESKSPLRREGGQNRPIFPADESIACIDVEISRAGGGEKDNERGNEGAAFCTGEVGDDSNPKLMGLA